MRMSPLLFLLSRARRRLAREEGFTMVVALLTLLVTSLLITATFVALDNEAHNSGTDLAAKQAYYAARAGMEQFLYDLNQNPNFWQSCTNDTQSATTLPGATGANPPQYAWAPVLANGATACSSSNAIGTLIDTSTGELTMEFYGYSGAKPQVTKGIVVSFRKKSPLDYLWYTVYEALDSSINGYSNCGQFYRTGSRPGGCNISWANNDVVNGPMYTQDQYMIGGTVTFGRNANDTIASAEPLTTNTSEICTDDSCGSAIIKGTPEPNAGTISPPSDNSALLTDAQNHGKVFYGTSTITVSGSTASVETCTSSSSCTASSVNLSTYPIIYVANATSCSPASYSPFDATYPINSSGYFYGCAGDAYVNAPSGYTASFTLASANNIVLTGNMTTNLSGSAVAGLVANQFIRVEHGVTNWSQDSYGNDYCTNNSSQSTSNLTIDAAILALQHSFIVDNYDCGGTLGTLTVNGAIAQYFRGTVATSSSGTVQTGYVKSYNYDDRLKALSPPYLFDIASAGWSVVRENLCVPGGASPTGC